MAVMDEFREEREALRHGTWKEKLSYFIYYYKWHTVLAALAVIFVTSTVVQKVSQKETVLYACLLNALEAADSADYIQRFADYADIDTGDCDVVFDATMTIDDTPSEETIANMQRLMVYIAAAELDVMISDAHTIETYANSEYFYDLREFLAPEQLSRIEPHFYYVDRKSISENKAAVEDLDMSYVPDYPDPRNPESMEDPIPVGIFLEGGGLNDLYYFQGEDVVLGIFANTTNPETVTQFIDFIIQ